ncbi:MAG: peptide-methionine (S)-S-oxide reductase MsrA [Candidatus Woesearchaeota archaeon]|nr:peptide-methionine (S)-S-oxide reductase MsrA [Candidatus Woesearchaeota archaeon]
MRYLILLLFFVSCVSTVEVVQPSETALATFAGGCFWCMEPPFEKKEGVIEVISGYSGGHVPHPAYKQVTSGSTGHLEVVQVVYDPAIISYKELLDVFWRQVNPTDDGGQFVDRGFQYTTAIFSHGDEQKTLAEQSKEAIAAYFDEPIVTPIREFEIFYPAEEYHQNYYLENPVRYKFYRSRSGRDDFLKEQWGS